MSRRSPRILGSAGAIAALAVAAPVLAEPAAPNLENATPPARPTAAPQPAGPATDADIVVTAQRREQRLQDVPISVSVLSADTLRASGVNGTDALQAVTPGLITTRQLRGSTPYIRGMGTQSTAPGVESPVAQYVDGVYYMTTVGNLFGFNNIERVEVLRGPQGTLFGRNTTGGLVQIITRDPSPEAGVEGSLSYGNYNTVEGSLYATAGSDNLAGAIALYGIRNDGFGRNLTIGGRVNRLDERSARAKLLWTPGTDTRVTLSADYDRNKGDIGPTRNAVAGSLLLTARPFMGTIYDTQGGFLNNIDTRAWGVSLHIQQGLGAFSLQSITAYRDLDSTTHFDQDAVPANFADVSAREIGKTFQQEVLLTGRVGSLNLTTGLFYFHAKNAYSPLAVRSVIPSSNYDLYSPQTLNSYAAFADGTLALTPTTNVTAGARYTIDNRGFNAYQAAVAGNSRPVGTILSSSNTSATFRKLTFRFVIDQRLAPDVMLYASFNRGFRAGVFNPSVLTQAVINPETVDAYEAGLRTELFGRTLRFNVSVFRNMIQGIQLTRQTLGAQTVYNAAEGRSTGAEAVAIYIPHLRNGRLQISANFSVLDAVYSSFPLGQITVPNAAGGDSTIFGSLTGRRMIRSPKFTSSIGFDYGVPVGAIELGAAGNFYHSSSFFWEPDNRLIQKAYNVINAQIYVAFGSDHQFRARAFVNNLADERYFSYVSAGGLGDLAAPSAPRTYGIGFDFRF